ncbi:MAG: succinate dehydrogenase [Rhodospirillales bacterium]|nr:succinate dehydrogenase [Rhodospirillales bacterium]
MSGALIVRAHRHPGLLAALLNRISGLALALFLPAHFIVLGLALSGAPALERFLALTDNPLMRTLEAGLVGALALHFACGLRILAIELLDFREKTAVAVAACLAFAFFFGLLFLLSAEIGG